MPVITTAVPIGPVVGANPESVTGAAIDALYRDDVAGCVIGVLDHVRRVGAVERERAGGHADDAKSFLNTGASQ